MYPAVSILDDTSLVGHSCGIMHVPQLENVLTLVCTEFYRC